MTPLARGILSSGKLGRIAVFSFGYDSLTLPSWLSEDSETQILPPKSLIGGNTRLDFVVGLPSVIFSTLRHEISDINGTNDFDLAYTFSTAGVANINGSGSDGRVGIHLIITTNNGELGIVVQHRQANPTNISEFFVIPGSPDQDISIIAQDYTNREYRAVRVGDEFTLYADGAPLGVWNAPVGTVVTANAFRLTDEAGGVRDNTWTGDLVNVEATKNL